MEVTEEYRLILVPPQDPLKVKNRRGEPPIWVTPLPIQVQAGHRAPIVPEAHTIRVEHRDDLEEKSFSEVAGPFGCPSEVL